jgi:hypothetical protein
MKYSRNFKEVLITAIHRIQNVEADRAESVSNSSEDEEIGKLSQAITFCSLVPTLIKMIQIPSRELPMRA